MLAQKSEEGLLLEMDIESYALRRKLS